MYIKARLLWRQESRNIYTCISNYRSNPRVYNSNDHSFEQAMEYFKHNILSESLTVFKASESRRTRKVESKFDVSYKKVRAGFKVRVWKGPFKELEESINNLLADYMFTAPCSAKAFLEEHWDKISKKVKFSRVGMEFIVIKEE